MSKGDEIQPYELLHWNMIRGMCLLVLASHPCLITLAAHHAFKLGYDKIIDVLANVPMNDLKNFLGYCEAWALTLQDHHDCEVRTAVSTSTQ